MPNQKSSPSKGKQKEENLLLSVILTCYSGMFAKDLTLANDETTMDKEDFHLFLLTHQKIYIYGTFESNPTYLPCQLNSAALEMKDYNSTDHYVSQLVIDHFLANPDLDGMKLKLHSAHPATISLYFITDIGLPPRYNSDSDVTHDACLECQSNRNLLNELPILRMNIRELETQLELANQRIATQDSLMTDKETTPPVYDPSTVDPDENFNPKSPIERFASHYISLLYFYYYNSDVKDWSTMSVIEMYDTWKREIPNLKVTEFQLNDVWKTLLEHQRDTRLGLAKAILACHHPDEQELIISGKMHKCALTPTCMLNEYGNLLDPEDSTISSATMHLPFKNYLGTLISEHFLKRYFATKRAQYGISISRSMWPLYNDTWSKTIINVVGRHSDECPILTPLKRPDVPSLHTRASSNLGILPNFKK